VTEAEPIRSEREKEPHVVFPSFSF
jgi:hypothetical protein